ncbi:MAG: glycosyltransferase family 39 protein [Burkholderiaceae bacterium]|jgi:4-amino-4-deoxy-L-arabinose transferase-like glycosyltransferase|nr:glycosyltransferase family 39 protein [Burkholderiaceae bacterium]
MPLDVVSDKLPARRAYLRGAAWWLMAALFALLLLLAALRPLALPDEGRYGEVGRWMAFSGDWLIPRLNGLPFFHKPPLLYWLEAASVTLLGATPWALRLAPALHAGLMLAALFLAARAFSRHTGAGDDGERLARRAALMLGSSPAFLVGGQYINHDMLVAAWIGVAIWCFAAAFLRGEKPHTGWALAGFAACALGVLSKGLIGLALPGLVLFIWLLWTRQFRKVWRLPWLRGLLLFAVIAVPWFVLAERRYPGLFAYLFGVQQFTRYVGRGFNNVQPWWFYLPCLILLLFPWAFFALAEGAARARRGKPSAAPLPAAPVSRQVQALCWIWIAAILIFFSIPRSKLIGYILPVMPPLALLAALGWGRWMHGRRAAGAWLAALTALPLVMVCVANIVVSRYETPRTSARNIALALACDAAPDDPVYAVNSFPYDLPFYARMTHPLIAVQNWAQLRVSEGDTWKREMFEAGDFEPARAARLLQSPPAALQTAHATPHAWVAVTQDHAAEVQEQGFRLVTQSGHWALYASPAKPLTPESPEAAEHKGLPGCQHRRGEPGP